MDTDLDGLRWFKSSASSAAGCVEIAHLPEGGVAVRDSKDRGKTPHVFNRHEWECFLIGAKNGEFDLPQLARPERRSVLRGVLPGSGPARRSRGRFPPTCRGR